MSRAMLMHSSVMALMICCLSAAPAETAPGSPESQVQNLKDQLAKERAQNAQLRARNEELEKHLLEMGAQIGKLEAQLKAPPTTSAIPQLKLPPILPNARALPPGWNEQQFNGLPVYIIPLQANGMDPGQGGMR